MILFKVCRVSIEQIKERLDLGLARKSLYILCAFLFTIAQLEGQNLKNFDKKHPIKISGSIGGTGTLYAVSGIPNRRQPFSYIVNGNITLNVLGIVKVPLSFMISEQNRKFQQPFNQIGFSPEYKWLKVHVGYRSLKWGEYSLAGYNFLMRGVEVQKEKYRAGFVYGRLNRKTTPDTLQFKNLLPAYRRMGFSVKLGYGKPNNFVDLVYFRSWDIRDSLQTPANYETVLPQQNAVLDIITQQKFLKKFTFKAEV
ncbi:MAG: hypothetical protein HYZ42_15640, partial [Bacteroidetes bacterium]|nr:hypothetical protein [Bacteroidota bacterium]